jgi:hypothetical protein
VEKKNTWNKHIDIVSGISTLCSILCGMEMEEVKSLQNNSKVSIDQPKCAVGPEKAGRHLSLRAPCHV